MKTRYIKVQGDTATPLPDRLQAESTHSLELTNENYDAFVSPFYFKVVNGAPVAKTQAEIDADKLSLEKENAIKEAEQLYNQLKEHRTINGYDLSDMFSFDYQRRNLPNVRVKIAGGKTEVKPVAETDDLADALNNYLNTCADALDADIDDIENGIFTLTNLKAIEATL